MKELEVLFELRGILYKEYACFIYIAVCTCYNEKRATSYYMLVTFWNSEILERTSSRLHDRGACPEIR